MELMTEEEARATMLAMIDSREWWVIPWLHSRCYELCSRVEQRHYTGKASADFLIVYGFVAGAMVPTVFAKKRRMGPRAFGRILAECMADKDIDRWAELVTTQDVIIVCPDDTTGEAEAVRTVAHLWHEWVIGRLSST